MPHKPRYQKLNIYEDEIPQTNQTQQTTDLINVVYILFGLILYIIINACVITSISQERDPNQQIANYQNYLYNASKPFELGEEVYGNCLRFGEEVGLDGKDDNEKYLYSPFLNRSENQTDNYRGAWADFFWPIF